MSNHDIEGRVPPETAPDAANPQSGAPDSLERQLAKEREARQLIRDRLRHTEALAAESHALRAQMAEELERVTADRDRLRAEASIAAAVAVPEPAAASQAAAPAGREPAPSASAAKPRGASPDLREPPAGFDAAATLPGVPGGARAAAGARPARGAEPTMTPPPPRARDEHPLGERPLKPPVRRGPWRALAMLGGLAAAVAGLAWITGTMPSGLELSTLMPSSASAPGTGAAPAASAPALAMDSQPEGAATAAATAAPAPSATLAATTPPQGAVPLPPVAPEAQLAAAPTAAGPVATAAAVATGPASVPPPAAATPSPAPAPAPASLQAHGQSQIQAEGGLDVRLRKALDSEGITSIVEIDPASGHVRVADPQADRALRERTDMLIRAVYAGASLPEPQIEHRWMSPMHGERTQQQAQAAPAPAPAAPAKGLVRPTTKLRGTPPPTLAQAQPQPSGGSQHDLTNAKSPGLAAVERVNLAPPGAGGPTRHVESGRSSLAVADMEDLRPVVPAGRVTASCMEDLAGKTSSNRRAALTSCMKRSCCSSSTNLNSDECRAYQKAYPYACGAG